jgi:L-iditol 2-dehydrogenase
MSETMRALVFHGPGDVRLETREVPQAKPGEVLVRVGLAGICGSDVNKFRDRDAPSVRPYVPGHEFFGTVVSAASDVESPRMGATVAINPLLSDGSCPQCIRGRENLCMNRALIGGQRDGGFAEFVTVPAHACVLCPDSVTAESAALVEPLACAMRVEELAVSPTGLKVLIVGAGMIGLLVLSVLRRAGSIVHIADISPARRGLARAWGAGETLGLEDLAPVQSEQPKYPLVVDAVGTEDTRRIALDNLDRGGRAIFVGLHSDTAALPTKQWVVDEWEVRGSFAYTRRGFANAVAQVGAHISPHAADFEQMPLADGPKAFGALSQLAISAPRVLLNPQ